MIKQKCWQIFPILYFEYWIMTKLQESVKKITPAMLGWAVALVTMGTQYVVDTNSLKWISQAASDMASSLVQNLAKIFPVLVPVLVVAFIIGLVIGIIRRR